MNFLAWERQGLFQTSFKVVLLNSHWFWPNTCFLPFLNLSMNIISWNIKATQSWGCKDMINYYNHLALKMIKYCSWDKWQKIGKFNCSLYLVPKICCLLTWIINIVYIVSSVSAQKLKCPGSALLGSVPFQLGSAREISARTHH